MITSRASFISSVGSYSSPCGDSRLAMAQAARVRRLVGEEVCKGCEQRLGGGEANPAAALHVLDAPLGPRQAHLGIRGELDDEGARVGKPGVHGGSQHRSPRGTSPDG